MPSLLETLYARFYSNLKQLGFDLREPARSHDVDLLREDSRIFASMPRASIAEAAWLNEYYSPRTNRVAMTHAAPAPPAYSPRAACPRLATPRPLDAGHIARTGASAFLQLGDAHRGRDVSYLGFRRGRYEF